MMKIRTLVEWNEPDKDGKPGRLHKPGEVADIDPVVVFDYADLLKIGTFEEVKDDPSVVAAVKKDGKS